MATNLHIDVQLLQEAKELGGLATKRETVDAALREFIQRRQRREALSVFGSIDFEDTHDYKRARAR